MKIDPIGTFHCAETYPYDAARQGSIALDNVGRVVLNDGFGFEQALQDLDGFSHVWLIFQFHHNPDWKPLVRPPRGRRKVGVFASRAPYRPNAIGLSCVRLLSASGRVLEVADHDLIDGTPILDIKPYIPYADSIPEATAGWLEELDEPPWAVHFSDEAREQMGWLESHGVVCLEGFLVQQLGDEPFNRKRKRVRQLGDAEWEIAYRTWRARFTADVAQRVIRVEGVCSGYSVAEFGDDADRYGDKAVHRAFVERYPS